MSDKIFTRLGDGEGVWMSKEEIREDVLAGMEDAVKKGKSEPLSSDDIEKLVEILTMPNKNVSVERGNEGVVTFDAGTLKLPVRAGIPVDRSTALLIHERILCSDTMELCNVDYSYKALKNIISEEAMAMEYAQLNCIMPIFYGAMPNMGLYTKPDGPVENWSEALPQGRIKEAMAAISIAGKILLPLPADGILSLMDMPPVCLIRLLCAVFSCWPTYLVLGVVFTSDR